MNCTWKDCAKTAIESIPDRNGNEWANLCEEHTKKLADAVASLDPKRLLGAWACAGSDHPRRKQMANDAAKGCGAIVELANRLRRK